MYRRHLLLGILIVAFFLRAIKLDQPLWPDEAWHAHIAKNLLTTGELTFDGTHRVYQAPFFQFAVALNFAVFGISEFSARMMGPFFGTAGVAAVYFLGRRLYSERVGITAAFFLAVMSRHWFFSRMIIPDVFLTTITTLTLLFLYESFESKKIKDFLILGALLAPAVMIKSIGLLMYPVMIAYAIYRGNPRGALIVFLVSVLAGLPWYLKNPETIARLIPNIKYYIDISSTLSFSPYQIVKIEAFYLVASLLPILLILPFSFYFGKEKIKESLLLLLPVLFFVPVVSTWHGNIEISRYLLPTLPSVAILGAFALDEISKRLDKRASYSFAGIFLVFVLLTNLQSGFNLIEINYPKYKGYKEAGEWIDQNTPADAVVMSNARAIWYYSNRSCTYFPETEGEFWKQAGPDDTYVVIGEWPVHGNYPLYVQTLPERYPSKIGKIITFNDDSPKIYILQVPKDSQSLIST